MSAKAPSLCAGYDTGCQSVAAGAALCPVTGVTTRGTGNSKKYYVDVYRPERKPDMTYAYPLFHVNCDSMASQACIDAGWKAPVAAVPVPVPPVAVLTVPVTKTHATFRPDADLIVSLCRKARQKTET